MQDGSTIDLSVRTNALPRVSAFTGGEKTLKFADNATVKIRLGEMKASSKTPIVSWTTAPKNIAGLKFVCGDERRKYSVVKKDDGLYINTGFVVIVKQSVFVTLGGKRRTLRGGRDSVIIPRHEK